ncbi:MAG: (d)CMP kinase [Flavobacteriaceae bacterium]|jgi:cytidylate kinase|nr:(d)CMP kinase [Flavobacteriaceae bacterium]
MKKNPIIAIDGYSSTGKSTYAKMLARKFGWVHIDTGAMYRAVTLYGLEHFFDGKEIDAATLIQHLDEISIQFQYNSENQSNETYLNGQNVENKIREIQVSEHVSTVAKIPEVRTFLVKQQRKIGKNGGIVMDGRDIGTVVFPNADLKLFITASVKERAMRRFLEFQKKNENISLEEVKENLQHRDFIDQNRAVSPLTQAADAVLIDNSLLTKQQTFEEILKIVVEKLEN